MAGTVDAKLRDSGEIRSGVEGASEVENDEIPDTRSGPDGHREDLEGPE